MGSYREELTLVECEDCAEHFWPGPQWHVGEVRCPDCEAAHSALWDEHPDPGDVHEPPEETKRKTA